MEKEYTIIDFCARYRFAFKIAQKINNDDLKARIYSKIRKKYFRTHSLDYIASYEIDQIFDDMIRIIMIDFDNMVKNLTSEYISGFIPFEYPKYYDFDKFLQIQNIFLDNYIILLPRYNGNNDITDICICYGYLNITKLPANYLRDFYFTYHMKFEPTYAWSMNSYGIYGEIKKIIDLYNYNSSRVMSRTEKSKLAAFIHLALVINYYKNLGHRPFPNPLTGVIVTKALKEGLHEGYLEIVGEDERNITDEDIIAFGCILTLLKIEFKIRRGASSNIIFFN